MVEMKTSELIGKPLDWAVAQYVDKHVHIVDIHWGNYCPSTNWAVGGPIIERERLCIDIDSAGVWMAWSKQNYEDEPRFMVCGPTPLIAAMRCLVASKLGDNIDIPEELK